MPEIKKSRRFDDFKFTNNNLFQISDLQSDSTDWIIRAHVIRSNDECITDINTMTETFKFVLRDSSSSINCLAFNTSANHFMSCLKPEGEYYVKNGKLSPSSSNYSIVKYGNKMKRIQMVFNWSTKIEEVINGDPDGKQLLNFSKKFFYSIEHLKDLGSGILSGRKSVEIIG